MANRGRRTVLATATAVAVLAVGGTVLSEAGSWVSGADGAGHAGSDEPTMADLPEGEYRYTISRDGQRNDAQGGVRLTIDEDGNWLRRAGEGDRRDWFAHIDGVTYDVSFVSGEVLVDPHLPGLVPERFLFDPLFLRATQRGEARPDGPGGPDVERRGSVAQGRSGLEVPEYMRVHDYSSSSMVYRVESYASELEERPGEALERLLAQERFYERHVDDVPSADWAVIEEKTEAP